MAVSMRLKLSAGNNFLQQYRANSASLALAAKLRALAGIFSAAQKKLQISRPSLLSEQI
jgi:hypothetical protein